MKLLSHDTIAVYQLQRQLITFPKKKKKNAFQKELFYRSDGAVSQYKKQKTFANLIFHSIYFGVKAEWHFFTMSHGRTPRDNTGSTFNSKKTSKKAVSERHTQTNLYRSLQLGTVSLDRNVRNVRIIKRVWEGTGSFSVTFAFKLTNRGNTEISLLHNTNCWGSNYQILFTLRNQRRVWNVWVRRVQWVSKAIQPEEIIVIVFFKITFLKELKVKN